MNVLGVAGWSGSGKTSLIIRLIPELKRRGLAVSTVKHAHHHFDIDRPGKDSYRHREAGAHEVLVSSGQRWALMHEVTEDQDWSLDTLLARMAPVDLVLAEGFKFGTHRKIEVHRQDLEKPLLCLDDTGFLAVVGDRRPDDVALPWYHRDDSVGLVDFISEEFGLGQ
jgi:molybdopterin-guanine dinucleotide biosynthesis protein B